MGKTYKAVEITKLGTFHLTERPLLRRAQDRYASVSRPAVYVIPTRVLLKGGLAGRSVSSRAETTKQLVRIEEIEPETSLDGRSVSASVLVFLAAKTEPARAVVAATRHIARTPLSLA